MSVNAVVALAVALTLELAIAEPPARLHPVAWFGRMVGAADRAWSHPRIAGGVVALGLPLAAAFVCFVGVGVASRIHPFAGVVAAGVVLFSVTSLRMLLEAASAVIAASDGAPDAARDRLPTLVGRGVAGLSPGQMRSAAVESASENLADGLVGPLCAFTVVAAVVPDPLALPVAAGAAVWVKAVNTLDSMLGYPAKPHGWASARLDDFVMWIPARVSAVLVALAAWRPRAVWQARRWAHLPLSPNSGWPMGTLAAALDARLEKPGAYTLNPAGSLPDVAAGRHGVRVVATAGLSAYLLGGVVAWW